MHLDTTPAPSNVSYAPNEVGTPDNQGQMNAYQTAGNCQTYPYNTPAPASGACPHCGYCPHCGRSTPTHPVQPYIWCQTPGTTYTSGMAQTQSPHTYQAIN